MSSPDVSSNPDISGKPQTGGGLRDSGGRPHTTVRANALPKLAGGHLGRSAWHEITQDQVILFAEATGDHQWIHVDPERAKSGPFGGTIAHGYLTLSMFTALLDEVLQVEGVAQIVNYGVNKARFPAPVPVGSKIALAVDCAAVEEVRGGYQLTFAARFEREGESKPVCVAEILFRYYLEEAGA